VLCGEYLYRRLNMGLMDYIKPVPTKRSDDVKDFLNRISPDDYNLLDVRLSEEYDEGHLPGAQLIPLNELSSRLKELDPEKPTFAY
jgi:rhodanese-related sulfurtransferase